MGCGEEERQAYYTEQGGWDGYTWGAAFRTCFVFSDSLEVGSFLGPGQGEGEITRLDAARMANILPTKCFAGIVCVAN